jgi:hypothetical protein
MDYCKTENRFIGLFTIYERDFKGMQISKRTDEK